MLRVTEERWRTVFEESVQLINELRECTRVIADHAYRDADELERLSRRCRTLRHRLDEVLNEIQEFMTATSTLLSRSEELKRWYNVFQEKVREVHDVTIRAMQALQSTISSLDEDIARFRQTRRAIQSYSKNQWVK